MSYRFFVFFDIRIATISPTMTTASTIEIMTYVPVSGA